MLDHGKILERALAGCPKQQYYLYIPTRLVPHAPIFVTVHGISRNAIEHAEAYAPFAEQYGVILVAPYFCKKEFAGYQRLKEQGKRSSDITLNNVIDEVGALTGGNTERLYLFGYSGGAQFVHRYMMAYPHRVVRVSIGAAGWYTFPDLNEKYPRGLRVGKKHEGLNFVASQFLHVPAQVLVGTRDKRQDEELNQSAKITLQQGATRLQRGESWIAAMQAAAQAHRLPTQYVFEKMRKCSHSFRRCMERGNMGELVFNFLFGPPPAKAVEPMGGMWDVHLFHPSHKGVPKSYADKTHC
jgi:pimeloyl-ACP methyl ester carboxylesterase